MTMRIGRLRFELCTFRQPADVPKRLQQGLPDSEAGTFIQALHDEARNNGGTAISTKNDWKRVFSFEP